MGMNEVWATKHRPSCLENFVGQDHIVDYMTNIIEGTAPMQHLLFHSKEPGTGKTTMAHILAGGLDYQVMKFNASSKQQRGIEFVQNDIAPMSRSGQWETIFFLDEADRITIQAQDALKGVIEDAQGYFILTCNDLNKVSPWLQSRCQVITFNPIDKDSMMGRLATIAMKEGHHTMTSENINLIVNSHNGDLRNAIGALQMACSLEDKERGKFLLSLRPDPFDSRMFLGLCFKENSFEDAYKMVQENNDVRNLVRQVFDFAVESPAKPDNKMVVVRSAKDAELRFLKGVHPTIVLAAFVSDICEGSKGL